MSDGLLEKAKIIMPEISDELIIPQRKVMCEDDGVATKPAAAKPENKRKPVVRR